VRACLFDLDGVLTATAEVHRAAWTDTFDRVLAEHPRADGSPQPPFSASDYLTYVDGRARADGVRELLRSRDVTLPEGDPEDGPSLGTIAGVAATKNDLLLERIRRDGVRIYDGSRRYLEEAAAAGLRRAVVSASENTHAVLEATGLDRWVEVVVDGVVIRELHLAGKPAPDAFVVAAERLGVEPAAAAVFEDALAGVEAGAAGQFGLVVGVDRVGQADALRRHGADIVVDDLEDLLR